MRFLLFSILLAACNSANKERSGKPSDDVSSVQGATPIGSVACLSPDGEQCPKSSEPACCGAALRGARIDLVRRCLGAPRFLACLRGKQCISLDAASCLQRDLPDGGVEQFEVPAAYPLESRPGFYDCSAQATELVNSGELRACDELVPLPYPHDD